MSIKIEAPQNANRWPPRGLAQEHPRKRPTVSRSCRSSKALLLNIMLLLMLVSEGHSQSHLDPASALQQAFVRVARQVKPAIATIIARHRRKLDFKALSLRQYLQLRRLLGDRWSRWRNEQTSMGSGVLISADGWLLTTDHLVEEAQTIVVILPNLNDYQARVVGRDVQGDIALLKITTDHRLPFVPLGNSAQLQVGQWVIAMGNSLGISSQDAQPTMTVGIVSALGRVVHGQQGRRIYGNAIQTDAALNPGNSGGALLDLQGRLIGINSAISIRKGINTGVGFAIPINQIKQILPDLKQGRQVQHGWLGIRLADLSRQGVQRLGRRGVLITQALPNQPAARAGLRKLDLIVAVNDVPVLSKQHLINRLSALPAGMRVKLTIVRNKRPLEFWVRLVPKPHE